MISIKINQFKYSYCPQNNISPDIFYYNLFISNRNYILNAGAMFRGNFADVSSALVRAFARARPAPVATFYKGNRVLVIETMEDENAYD